MITKLGSVITEYAVRNKHDEDIPVYSVTNEQGFCTGYFSKDVASKDRTTYKIVPRGYFAYNPSRINVGSVDWQDCQDRVIVSPLYVVFGVDEKLDQQYLLHYLKSDITLTYIKALATGSVRDNLKFSILQEFPINLRPIEEQRKIASVLDRIDRVIALRNEELETLDNLVKSRFIELFGDPEHNEKQWAVLKLETLCSVSSSKRIYQNELSAEGVPFLRISDLVNRMDTGSTECELYIPEERYEELKVSGLVPVAGDMLLTARGTLGRCYTLTASDKFYFQDGMITWLYGFDKKLTTNYLTHLFSMSGFRKQIDSLQAGSTVAYLSIAMTKKLDVMLPPIELQNQFATFVEQTEKSKYYSRLSLALCRVSATLFGQEWMKCQTSNS